MLGLSCHPGRSIRAAARLPLSLKAKRERMADPGDKNRDKPDKASQVQDAKGVSEADPLLWTSREPAAPGRKWALDPE